MYYFEFKILKGFDHLDISNYCESSTATTRGYALKLVKQGCHLDCRKYCFPSSVINIWNSLIEEVIACDSLNSFKASIDKCLKGRGFI